MKQKQDQKRKEKKDIKIVDSERGEVIVSLQNLKEIFILKKNLAKIGKKYSKIV